MQLRPLKVHPAFPAALGKTSSLSKSRRLGASNDASCVSWDAFLKMRWIFATKSAEASCERRLLMELQALGPATIQDEKSTLQKTAVFCLVSFFFFYFFLLLLLDAGRSVSLTSPQCWWILSTILTAVKSLVWQTHLRLSSTVSGKAKGELNMFHVSSTQCRTCKMPMLHSWAFRETFITIYAIVVVSSCIPIDLPSISKWFRIWRNSSYKPREFFVKMNIKNTSKRKNHSRVSAFVIHPSWKHRLWWPRPMQICCIGDSLSLWRRTMSRKWCSTQHGAAETKISNDTDPGMMWWGRVFILNGKFMKILEDIEYRE